MNQHLNYTFFFLHILQMTCMPYLHTYIDYTQAHIMFTTHCFQKSWIFVNHPVRSKYIDSQVFTVQKMCRRKVTDLRMFLNVKNKVDCVELAIEKPVLCMCIAYTRNTTIMHVVLIMNYCYFVWLQRAYTLHSYCVCCVHHCTPPNTFYLPLQNQNYTIILRIFSLDVVFGRNIQSTFI